MFKRPLIWVLTAFIIVCLLSEKNHNSMDSLFDDEIQGSVSGRVDQIIKKETGTSIYLKDVTLQPLGAKQYYCNKILAYSKLDTNLKVGNSVNLSGKIMKFQRPTNPGQFDEAQYYKSNQVDYKIVVDKIQLISPSYSKIRAILYVIREKLVISYGKSMNEKEAGIIDAMLLGEKSRLDTQVKEMYQDSGISHILVISGLNISLIGIALYQLLKRLGMPQIPTSCFTILIIYYYGLLTEFSVSTNRAVVMLMLSLVAVMIGRTYDLISAMALSAIVILFQSPMQILNSGFLLSFGAVLGIAYLVPAFRSILPEKKQEHPHQLDMKGVRKWIIQIIKEGFIITCSTNLVTLPIILYYYFEFPLYGVLINILLIPFMSILVILGMIGGLVGCFWTFGGTFLMGGVHYILCIIEYICNLFSKLPFHTVVVGRPKLILILFYYLVLIVFIFIANHYPKKMTLFCLLFLSILFVRRENHELQITTLDVGQGDCIVMETPREHVYLMDGGSSDVSQVGKYRILPYLKYNGIGSIQGIIVSHGDEDHINGIRELLDQKDVLIHALIIPSVPVEKNGLGELVDLAKEKGVKVVVIKKWDQIQEEGMVIRCLHPDSDFEAESCNSYSTVLSVEYGEFDALLTGDLEGEAEEQLEVEEEYDLLKVAHHGSKNSSSDEFLKRVNPKLSIISCGKNNRYGHPHKELLERLSIAESKVLITTKYGAITVTSNGEDMQVTAFCSDK